MTKLLLCPFCGSYPSLASLGGDGENFMIWCSDCGIPSVEMGVHGETKEELVEKWNTRFHEVANCDHEKEG